MIKDIRRRRKPDSPTQNVQLEGVPSKALYWAAEIITYKYAPKSMCDDPSTFDDSWFYKLPAKQQNRRLAQYFTDLVDQDAKEIFQSEISYYLESMRYDEIQKTLNHKAKLKGQEIS